VSRFLTAPSAQSKLFSTSTSQKLRALESFP